MCGKDSLENMITQKGVVSEEGLHHEFDGPVPCLQGYMRHE